MIYARVNPIHIVRRTQCCVCAVALGILPEKCEFDDALLVDRRILAPLRVGSGSPKKRHTLAAKKIFDNASQEFSSILKMIFSIVQLAGLGKEFAAVL